MGKNRSPDREKAFKIYKKHIGNITCREIGCILGKSERTISYWRKEDNWKQRYNPKGGAPLGNKNALGHKGITPQGNQNARKEGWYSKYYPLQSRNIIKELQESNADPIEIQWAQIVTQFAAIINAQKIMFVKDHNDMTKELKKTKVQRDMVGSRGNKSLQETYREEEYDIQYAWDKQANFLKAQSRAMGELRNSIKQYETMIRSGLATEEQKLRIKKLRVSINATKKDIQNRKELNDKKMQLERERFDHQKKVDELKNF
jgi:uncharacterized protein YjcR